TQMMMEFQITQEYLGQGTHLVYLRPLFKEVLEADTYQEGAGSSVGKIVDGSLNNQNTTAIAGVANIGTDRNWTSHPFAQSNWYAYGRLAWDYETSVATIAEDWIRMTFSNHENTVTNIKKMMLESHEAVVNYMTPLGLHHIMGAGHHYGPGPWVDKMSRADWTSVYYHKADSMGIGFDRTDSGSGAISQYKRQVARIFEDPERCPEKYLLWFHHLPWDYQMSSGKILWQEIALHYQKGVEQVEMFLNIWSGLEAEVDEERFNHVTALLEVQHKEAIWWRDACLAYFQTFSAMDFPEGVPSPEYDLEYYKNLSFPYAPGIRPRW
ncbi:MAG: alpha-glucuronidase, partial [Saprospiraceae bacterium]|nr:alpha-glucuronidase [Saprospiraceae bacterium]